MKKIIIDSENAGRRLDKYLFALLKNASKGLIFSSLRKKNIRLNGAKAEGGTLIRQGDVLEIFFSDDTFAKLSGLEDGPSGPNTGKAFRMEDFCHIVYEDDSLIVADKKRGVLSQGTGSGEASLNDVLLSYTLSGQQKDGLLYTPSVCNRLDKNTSGLVLFAKTYQAARELSRIIADRSIEKYYLAAVKGSIKDRSVFKGWLKKDSAKNISSVSREQTDGSQYIETVLLPLTEEDCRRVSDRAGRIIHTEYVSKDFTLSLVKLKLMTGRSHQIRAQLAHEGHPVAGDPKYGDISINKTLKAKYGTDSQLLCSYALVMPAFLNGPLEGLSGKEFHSVLPADILSLF